MSALRADSVELGETAMPLVTTRDKVPQTAGTALTYITIGAILTVLSATSFFFFSAPFSDNQILGYIRMASLILGVVLMVIGFTVIQLAKTAAHAEVDARAEQIVAHTAQEARAAEHLKT